MVEAAWNCPMTMNASVQRSLVEKTVKQVHKEKLLSCYKAEVFTFL